MPECREKLLDDRLVVVVVVLAIDIGTTCKLFGNTHDFSFPTIRRKKQGNALVSSLYVARRKNARKRRGWMFVDESRSQTKFPHVKICTMQSCAIHQLRPDR